MFPRHSAFLSRRGLSGSPRPNPMGEATPQPEARADQPRLIPALGLFSATMLVAGGVIGSGIFRKAGVMASQVGSPEVLLGVWLVAGVISLLGTLSNAELAAMMPQTGTICLSPSRFRSLRGVPVRLGVICG